MAKKPVFRTRSLGSEQPVPSAGEISGWIESVRGHEADRLTFQLALSLWVQVSSGIPTPCAGGAFYGERLKGSESPPESGDWGEERYDPDLVRSDFQVAKKISRDFSVAIPLLPMRVPDNERGMRSGGKTGSRDGLYELLRRVLQTAREEGSRYQVIHAKNPSDEDLEALTGRRSFFFLSERNEENLARVLEFQRILVISPDELELGRELSGSYTISRCILLDAERSDLLNASENFGDDAVEAGGYCPGDCPEYWARQVRAATLTPNQRPRQVSLHAGYGEGPNSSPGQ